MSTAGGGAQDRTTRNMWWIAGKNKYEPGTKPLALVPHTSHASKCSGALASYPVARTGSDGGARCRSDRPRETSHTVKASPKG